MRNLRVTTALLALLVGALMISTPAKAGLSEIPTPAVTGPIPATADSYPFLATDIDLDKFGYVEEEFFIEGDAWRYDTSVPFTDTAPRIETGGTLDDGAFPFKTRIVVRRPASPADANGTVLAEWYNVTAFQDVEFNWFGDPFYLLKHGYTFVGVSAQTTGISALKGFDPARYSGLTVNGNDTVPTGTGLDRDALSYDIFASALKSLLGEGTGVDPIGGIDAKTLVASGESQSCSRLSAHYNRIEPIHEIVDAYLLTVCSSELRTDRPEKAIRIISESENRTPRPVDKYPDTASLRHWEVAGGSHLPRIAFDNLNASLSRDFAVPVARCEKFPLSLVPWPFTQNRAIDAMVKWANGGGAPPVAPRGQYVPNPDFDSGLPPSSSNREVILDRDQQGIAIGAIRYPEMDVPVGVNDGTNSQAPDGPLPFSLFCGLFGSTTGFESELLHSLYTDYADYVTRYAAAADAMLPVGFILPEDVERLKQSSRQFAELRPSAPMLIGDSSNKGKFGLTWVGTEAPDTTFELQRRKSPAGGKWTDVEAGFDDATASLAGEPQGTHRYRVRNTTILPGTNISDPRTVVTPYSETVDGVKVDRAGPKKPRIIVKGKRYRKSGKKGGKRTRGKKGKKKVYRGKVKVKFIGKSDRKLPDGSPGVGLKRKSVPKTRRIKKKGRTVVKAKTRDRLGNRSKTARVVIRIKR